MKDVEEKNFYDREDEHIRGIERFRKLEGREKWEFFKSYYLAKLILLVILLAITTSIIVDWAQARNDINLYVAVVEDPLTNQTLTLSDDFVSYVGSEEYDLLFSMNPEYAADAATLNVKIGLGGVNLLIADQDFHEKYPVDSYANLETLLGADTWEKVKEYVVYALDEQGEDYAYGIDLSACEKYQDLEPIVEHPIIAIPRASEHQEFSADFIRFLWDD